MTPALQKIVWDLMLDEVRRLEKKSLADQPDVGAWLGSYQLFPHASETRRFHFVNDLEDPLRFAHVSGFEFRPLDPFVTDLGSVPGIVQAVAPRKYARLRYDDWKEAFIQHDAACEFGRVWVRKGPDGPWKQMPCPVVQADVLLFWGLTAPTLEKPLKPATRLECQAIYRAVRSYHAAGGAIHKRKTGEIHGQEG